MAQVTVNIAGKSYRMACGEGEEPRLVELAALLDAKIADMRTAFGEIGDMRLHVMAALTFADDLLDARARLDAVEADVLELKSLLAGADERRQTSEDRVSDAVVRAAERIERLARTLSLNAEGASNAAPSREDAEPDARPR